MRTRARALTHTLSPPTQTSIDLFNYLLRQRIIFLAGYVNDKVGPCTFHSHLHRGATCPPKRGKLLVLRSAQQSNPSPSSVPPSSTTHQMATQIVGSLLALEAIDEEEDIRIYINSPGNGTEVALRATAAAANARTTTSCGEAPCSAHGRIVSCSKPPRFCVHRRATILCLWRPGCHQVHQAQCADAGPGVLLQLCKPHPGGWALGGWELHPS